MSAVNYPNNNTFRLTKKLLLPYTSKILDIIMLNSCMMWHWCEKLWKVEFGGKYTRLYLDNRIFFSQKQEKLYGTAVV